MKIKEFISDKMQFIFHRIILGAIFWMVFSFIIAYQQLINIQFVHKDFGSFFIGLLLIFVPYGLLLWFISISGRKNQWKPFAKHSNIIGGHGKVHL